MDSQHLPPQLSEHVSIRPYRAADKDVCLSIFDSNCPKFFDPNEKAELESFLGDKDHDEYFVVELNEEHGPKVVGTGGYYVIPETGVVGFSWGMILNEFHDRGLGKLLTTYRLNLLDKKFHHQAIRLQTSQFTCAFYALHGFVETEREPDGFGDGIDRITMIRPEGHELS